MTVPCPVFGFHVELTLAFGLSERTVGDLWRDFRKVLVESRGLTSERQASGEHWSITLRGEAGQATDADREAVVSWAADRSEVESIDVGPLVDLAEVG